VVPFAYTVAPSAPAAAAHVMSSPGAEYIAGGTDMLPLLQDGVHAPSSLVDITELPLTEIDVRADGARIGALARLSDIADDRRIQQEFPAVPQALFATASPQVRNMATLGGNLLQRTRCVYFRDIATPCHKRLPGSGCPALDGVNRMNAILGVSPHCIAAYPGDLAVALLALDAMVHVAGADGERVLRLEDLHQVPGETPHVETTLAPGELITAVSIPTSSHARRSHYIKVRDRASFEWALVSAAAALEIGSGTIRHARVAVGGVATKPWRLPQVEQALVGQRAGAETFRAAAERAAAGAETRPGNAFKLPLMIAAVARALGNAAGMS
jgi:xanthine dehydrogenase YagS FAD-binding subunit